MLKDYELYRNRPQQSTHSTTPYSPMAKDSKCPMFNRPATTRPPHSDSPTSVRNST